MIELSGITKKFTNSKKEIIVLNNVNKKFYPGKFYAIMGHSGSGKSTLLNIIGLLDKPSSGLLLIDDVELSYDEKIDLLSSDGMLVKRPILVTKDKVFVGFKEKEWCEIIK